jgi:DNA repair photolyase
MEIRKIECKTALSSSSLPGLDYSLNPYRGCQHNCAYCYVPNVLRIPRDEWGCFVDVKTNIPAVLSKELKKKKSGVVGISTVTDPYQPIENKYKLTQYCLEQLLIHDFPVCIQTKSKLILRDLDLVLKFSSAEVMVSIGTLNDSERRLLEPNASPINDRLEILRKCSERGIKTSVFFGPIYPSIKLSDISSIVDTFTEVGVSEIMFDKFNLKPGIFENLKRQYPTYYHLINDDVHYDRIFEEITMVCHKKNVKAISAF